MPLLSDRFFKRQDVAQLVALLLACLVLLVLPAGMRQGIGGGVVRVFFAPLELPLYQFRGLITSWHENAALRDELIRVRLENIALTAARRDNGQLRALLSLKGQSTWKLTSAQIVAREPALLTPDLIIDKGAADGLVPGMVAIAPRGLIGTVTDVAAASATVRTVFDPRSRVSAIDIRSRQLGVFRASKGTKCLLDLVPIRTDVRPGDTVVTSGYGQLFPYGLLLGVVDNVEVNKHSLIYQITIRPSADINALNYVTVISGGVSPPLPSLVPPASADGPGAGPVRRRHAPALAPVLKLQLPQIGIELPDSLQLKQERPR